jgi:hypothetical protein
MNINQFLSSIDPHNAHRMHHLETKIMADAQVERFRADRDDHLQTRKIEADRDREYIRANESMNRERFRADRDDSRLDRRFEQEKQLEERREQNSVTLSRIDHENKLTQMEESLRHSVFKSGFDSGILTIHKMMDEDTARRASLTKQFEDRSQLRGDVFKMLAGAIIQEKLAQRQHKRDLERSEAESIQRRTERYCESMFAYLMKLNESEGVRAMEDEISRLEREWGCI